MTRSDGLMICQGPDDPRLHEIDTTFRAVLTDIGTTFAKVSRVFRKRSLHSPSTTVSGFLEVLDQDDIVRHDFLRPGRRFGVLARYSNGLPADDIAPSPRGVTLRLFDGEPDPLDGHALLDLTLTTGECFQAATAHEFLVLDRTGPERDALLAREPQRRTIMWESHRTAVSYAEYDYYSQVPRCLVALDGTVWAARFRLVPPQGPRDLGRFDPGDQWLPPRPPGEVPRPADDTRSTTFLRDELRTRLGTAPLETLLQLQLHPLSGDPSADEAVFDATRSWAGRRWRDLARLRLTRMVSDDAVEPLRFNPVLAPPDLGVALATSPHQTTSIDHLRILVYQLASAARLGQRTAPATTAPRPPRARLRASDSGAGPRTVCVVGAGPGGLAVARELERLGHRAVVLEAAADVAGKCESVEVGGEVYDLGGHLCTTAYSRVAELVSELGVETEDITPYLIHDGSGGRPRRQPEDFFRPDVFRRYLRLRAERFPDIARPGLAHSARALADPVADWLTEHRLAPMARSLGTGYTAAGYGFLDSSLPALPFVKYAELTGLLSNTPQLLGHTGGFTPVGGFAGLWRRVAAELCDVRTRVRVERIERANGRVRVYSRDGVVDADDLFLAVPLDQMLSVLDVSEQEKELADLIEYMPYHTQLCTIGGLPRSAFYLLEQNTRAAVPGACVSFHHRRSGTDVYSCYSYGGDGLGPAQLEQRLAGDIKRLGGRLETVHEQRSWRFMPHFGSAAIRVGAYDRLEALQGCDHTYHVGGLPAFELVECVVSHAQDTVRRHFAPVAGGPAPGTLTVRPACPATSSPSDRATDGTVSAEAVRDSLVALLATETGVQPDEIDTAAPLDSFGLTSLSAAVLQAELSEWLGYRVPHTLLLEASSLDAVAGQLASTGNSGQGLVAVEETAGRQHGSMLLLPLSPARPLFLFGGIVGAAYYLRPLARAVGHAHPCYGLQSPGLDGSEVPLRRIEDLADRYVEALRSVQPQGPYTLAGHSFGGLVAYEAALQLADEGAEISRLVLLDTYVPVPGQRPPPPDEAAAIGELCRMNAALSGTPVREIDPALPLGRQREQLARMLGATGLPSENQVAHMLAVYQANLEAVVEYRISHAELPVTLIKATGGFPSVMAPGRTIDNHADEHNGWGAARLDDFEVRPTAGDHFTMLGEAHPEAAAALLQAMLRDRRPPSSGSGTSRSTTDHRTPEGIR